MNAPHPAMPLRLRHPTLLDAAGLAMLDGEMQLLINVYSSRKAPEDNILDCGIWQDVVSKPQTAKIEIACKLIGEE